MSNITTSNREAKVESIWWMEYCPANCTFDEDPTRSSVFNEVLVIDRRRMFWQGRDNHYRYNV